MFEEQEHDAQQRQGHLESEDVVCDACEGTGERPNGMLSWLARLCRACIGRGRRRELRWEDDD